MKFLDLFKRKKETERKKVQRYKNTRGLGITPDRLTETFTSSVLTGSINKHIRSSNDLRDQARTLAITNNYGKNFVQMVVDNVVGADGINPNPQVQFEDGSLDTKLNMKLSNMFSSWADNAKNFSLNGRMNWRDFCIQVERMRLIDGEVFIRIHKDEMQIEIISADLCDYNFQEKQENGNTIYQGIEYDERKRPVAYWFTEIDLMTQTNAGQRYRIPAEECLHYFIPDLSNQLRGISSFSAVIKPLSDLQSYQETAIVQKRILASQMGFITQDKDTNDMDIDDDVENPMQEIIEEFAPGEIKQLAPGQDIKSLGASQGVSDGYAEFIDTVLNQVTTGFGVFKQGFMGDTANINYSSAKFGDQTQRQRFRAIQQSLIDQVLKPVVESYIEYLILHEMSSVSVNSIPFIMNSITWIRPKRESIDPIKDTQNEILLIQNKLKSRAAVISDRGDDPAQVFAQIESEEEKFGQVEVINEKTEITENV